MLESSHSHLKSSLDTVVDKLDKILEQNTKVAVLAEKQMSHQADIERAHFRIEQVEQKGEKLAVEVREFISFIRGLTKLAYVLWSSLGGAVFLLAIKILFFVGKQGFLP